MFAKYFIDWRNQFVPIVFVEYITYYCICKALTEATDETSFSKY